MPGVNWVKGKLGYENQTGQSVPLGLRACEMHLGLSTGQIRSDMTE